MDYYCSRPSEDGVIINRALISDGVEAYYNNDKHIKGTDERRQSMRAWVCV